MRNKPPPPMVEVHVRPGKSHYIIAQGEPKLIDDPSVRFPMSRAAAEGPMADKVQIVGVADPEPRVGTPERPDGGGHVTGEADGSLEERRARAQEKHEAERDAAAGDDVDADASEADIDALEGLEFASTQARARAAHFELGADDFADESPTSAKGFNVDDVESIAVAKEEATAEVEGS